MTTVHWLRAATASLAAILALAASPAAAGDDLSLLGGRFRVQARWTTPDGASAAATGVPLTDESGTFWFFREGNRELLVKVLDACEPFDRYWVFAAGLTNLEVELTVEDTHAGFFHTYTNGQGTPFQPIQDTSTFATCGQIRECGLGTAVEVAATPRADRHAEAVARRIGGGFTADPDLYARVDIDLEAIDAVYPGLGETEMYGDVPDVLVFRFDEATTAAVDSAAYEAWECLNDWYGATPQPAAFPGATVRELRFAGIFDLDAVLPEYAALPGVVSVERSPDISAIVSPPPMRLCAAFEGEAIRYFTGPFHTYFRSPGPGQPAVLIGAPGVGVATEEWIDDFYACTEGL